MNVARRFWLATRGLLLAAYGLRLVAAAAAATATTMVAARHRLARVAFRVFDYRRRSTRTVSRLFARASTSDDTRRSSTRANERSLNAR